jgi:hypothetical protein
MAKLAAVAESESLSEVQCSAAYSQLLEICKAAEAGDITTRQFSELIDELRAYLDGRIKVFDAYPDLEVADYMAGLDKVTGALFRFYEASQKAAHFAEARSVSFLHEALSMAREAEDELAQGLHALERAQGGEKD